jgi:hypothetical protein
MGLDLIPESEIRRILAERDDAIADRAKWVEDFYKLQSKFDARGAALEAISNGEGAGGLAETERLQEIARAALTAPETGDVKP